MVLPSLKNLPVEGKTVLLRTNYDVPLKKTKGPKWVVADESRIAESLPTLEYLLGQKAKVIIVSHLGRPGGQKVTALSLKPVASRLAEFLKKEVPLISKLEALSFCQKKELLMLENLRFWPGEEKNDFHFAQELAVSAEFYVNDAFAVSHRPHASVVSLPALLPSAFGFDFLEEVRVLSRLRRSPRRPVVVILGGVKPSKTQAAKKLIKWADYILIGGRLIEYNGISQFVDHQKVLGSLTKSGEDITIKTIEEFKKIIALAGTIVWSGPMGAVEEKKFERGTREIAKAVVKSGAYTVVGGGDTEAALSRFGLVDKIDYISSGGGAMLAFLAQGTLAGIEAIKKTKYRQSS